MYEKRHLDYDWVAAAGWDEMGDMGNMGRNLYDGMADMMVYAY